MNLRFVNILFLLFLLSVGTAIAQPKTDGVIVKFKPVYYTVKKGDNLKFIAWKYNRNVKDLETINRVSRYSNLKTGTQVIVGYEVLPHEADSKLEKDMFLIDPSNKKVFDAVYSNIVDTSEAKKTTKNPFAKEAAPESSEEFVSNESAEIETEAEPEVEEFEEPVLADSVNVIPEATMPQDNFWNRAKTFVSSKFEGAPPLIKNNILISCIVLLLAVIVLLIVVGSRISKNRTRKKVNI